MELTILYDAHCPFCQRCRAWVEGQPTLVPCRFLANGSPAARALFGGVIPGRGRDLVVVSHDGAFWAGSDAFLVILWALEEHRGLAHTLATPWLRPFSGTFFDLVSSSRPLLSALFGHGHRCEEGHCGAVESAYR